MSRGFLAKVDWLEENMYAALKNKTQNENELTLSLLVYLTHSIEHTASKFTIRLQTHSLWDNCFHWP